MEVGQKSLPKVEKGSIRVVESFVTKRDLGKNRLLFKDYTNFCKVWMDNRRAIAIFDFQS